MKNGDGVKRPVETREFWHEHGGWKCVCVTSTHAKGQRFTQPQCAHCVLLREKS